MQRTITVDRKDECNNTGDPTSPSVLMQSTNVADRHAEQNYEAMVPLTPACMEELIWWDINMISWNKKSLLRKEIDITIDSDTFRKRWGSTCQGVRMGSPWSLVKSEIHINHLEMLAATLAMKTFMKDKNRMPVLLRSDKHDSSGIHQQPGGNCV